MTNLNIIRSALLVGMFLQYHPILFIIHLFIYIF